MTVLLIYVTLWANGLSPFRLLFAALSEFFDWAVQLNNKINEKHARELRAIQNAREDEKVKILTQAASAAAAACSNETLSMLPHELVHPHVVNMNNQGSNQPIPVLSCGLLGSDSHITHCDLRMLKSPRSSKKGTTS